MSEDSKTYVFDTTSKGCTDPATLLALMNNNGGFGGNGSWLWVIFLFFLYGWGGNGIFGRNGNGMLGNELNNDYGRTLLLQAINGNGSAISQLATTLNCDVNSITSAIGTVSSQIQSVGNSVGMSGQQVINAIQSGNQTLASQLAQCCCDNKLLVTNQGYENRIATLEQTNVLGSKMDGNSTAIGSKIDAQTTLINDKFCALEMREMQNKIDALREERSTLQNTISNANQTAQIQSYVNGSISPIATALAGLQSEVAGIKCKLPESVTIPYSPVVGVPSCVAANYGLGLYGVNGTSIWS